MISQCFLIFGSLYLCFGGGFTYSVYAKVKKNHDFLAISPSFGGGFTIWEGKIQFPFFILFILHLNFIQKVQKYLFCNFFVISFGKSFTTEGGEKYVSCTNFVWSCLIYKFSWKLVHFVTLLRSIITLIIVEISWKKGLFLNLWRSFI